VVLQPSISNLRQWDLGFLLISDYVRCRQPSDIITITTQQLTAAALTTLMASNWPSFKYRPCSTGLNHESSELKMPSIRLTSSLELILPVRNPALFTVSDTDIDRKYITHAKELYVIILMPYLRAAGISSDSIVRLIALYRLSDES
jgi:hypothetical protein